MSCNKTKKRRPNRKIVKRGEGIGNLIPLLMPVLKKVLPVIGMAALTGGVSAGASRVVSNAGKSEKSGKGVGRPRKPGPKRKPGRPRKGSGLLLGNNSPFKNIPLLNILL